MCHYKQDQIAKEMIKCCDGFSFQGVLDQLEYTKDFLFNRIIMRNIDYSAIDEEHKRHKKNVKS